MAEFALPLIGLAGTGLGMLSVQNAAEVSLATSCISDKLLIKQIV